jgi:hypothetical protein
MNARRTPQRVGNAHLSDQLPNFSRHAGATLTAPRLPAPVTPKTSAMPSHHGVGPNDGECLAGFRKQLADPTQHHSVDSQKWHPTGPAPSQNDDLLPQHKDLGFHRRARPEQIDDNPKNYSAEIQHPTEDHPILRLKPTVWNLRQEQLSMLRSLSR